MPHNSANIRNNYVITINNAKRCQEQEGSAPVRVWESINT